MEQKKSNARAKVIHGNHYFDLNGGCFLRSSHTLDSPSTLAAPDVTGKRHSDDPAYGSLEVAALIELVAQLVEQRPFNPILPLKSKIKRNNDIHS